MIRYVQLRLEDAELKDFKTRAEEAGYASILEAGRDALRSFFERGKGEDPGIPHQLREYPAKLARVLASGNPRAIAMVTGPIDYLLEELDRKANRTSTR